MDMDTIYDDDLNDVTIWIQCGEKFECDADLNTIWDLKIETFYQVNTTTIKTMRPAENFDVSILVSMTAIFGLDDGFFEVSKTDDGEDENPYDGDVRYDGDVAVVAVIRISVSHVWGP